MVVALFSCAETERVCNLDLEIVSIKANEPFVVEQPELVIGTGNHYVFMVNEATTKEQLSAIALDIKVAKDYIVTPESGTVQDFYSGPVIYTVEHINAKHQKKEYKVEARRVLYNEAELLSVTFDNIGEVIYDNPTIDENNFVDVILMRGTTAEQVSAVVPILELSPGAESDPEEGVAPGFVAGEPIEYTITSEDGSKKNKYTIQLSYYVDAEIEEVELGGADFVTDFEIDRRNINITVALDATAEQIASLSPEFTLSTGASISPESGSTPGFVVGEPVEYVVTSGDGESVTYKVTVDYDSSNITYFDFNDWEKGIDANGKVTKWNVYDGWGHANSMQGLINWMAPNTQPKDTYGADYTEEGRSGKAAVLTTLTTGVEKPGLVPGVVAGSMFRGSFATTVSMDQLTMTHFGQPYEGQPMRMSFYYKYTPGSTYFDNVTEVPGKLDSFSVAAVLFEIKNDDDHLNGHTIYTDESIVAIAKPYGNSNTTESFTRADLEFEYIKPYEAGKKYKLAILLSASSEGDVFKGATGSQLIVDDLTIYNK